MDISRAKAGRGWLGRAVMGLPVQLHAEGVLNLQKSKSQGTKAEPCAEDAAVSNLSNATNAFIEGRPLLTTLPRFVAVLRKLYPRLETRLP